MMLYNIHFDFGAHLHYVHKNIDNYCSGGLLSNLYSRYLGLIIINRGTDIKWLVCCKESTTVNLIYPHNI